MGEFSFIYKWNATEIVVVITGFVHAEYAQNMDLYTSISLNPVQYVYS